MIGSMKLELNKAKKFGYAIPAFNVINSEMIKQIISIADNMNSPVIIAIAEAHLDLISLDEALYIYKYYARKVKVPIILHLDHGKSISVVKKAIDLGYKSVMIDGSKYNYEKNVRITKEIVEYSKNKNVCVEAEIGHVGSNESYEDDTSTKSIYTNLEDAISFANDTGVCSLAVSVGTQHGLYKGIPKINFNRLEEISKFVTVPLVLHGGSSSGDKNLTKTIDRGISKINVFTDLVESINENLKENTDYFKLNEDVQKGIKNCVMHYIDLFKTNGGLNYND